MNQKKKQVKTITPIGRASFPSLHHARNFKGEGPLKYSCGIYLKTEDFLSCGLGELIENIASEEGFNTPIRRGGKEVPNVWHHPVRFRDEIKKMPHQLEGVDVCLLTAKTGEQYPPRVVGPDGHPYDPSLIHGGDFIRLSLIAKPWKTPMGQGVALYLSGCQLARHATEAEEFSSAEESFEKIESAEISDDWTLYEIS